METYHKIPTVFERDPETKFKTLIEGKFATPELEYLSDCDWQFTEKVDGMNIRVMWDGHSARFGGKSDNAQIPATLFSILHRDLFPPSTMMEVFKLADNVCLYGEGFGPKIQKGGNYLSEQSFALFDVMIDGMWLQRKDVLDIAEKLSLYTPKPFRTGPLLEAVEMARAGFCSAWGTAQAEGLVMRPIVELTDRRGNRIITKIKHKDFRA